MVPEPTDPVDLALRALAAPAEAEDLDAVAGLIDGPDAARLRQGVFRHRLDAAFADALERAGSPVPPEIAASVADDRLTRLRLQGVLTSAASALDAAGVPWLAFKGPVVGTLMPRPELRTYNDLDLLVSAARFGEAIDVLGEVGVEEVNENWTPYVRHRVGEVPMLGNGVTVDLHWHIVGLEHDRRSLGLEPAEMLARRRVRAIGERDIAVFDAEDQLLHVTVHAALTGATRLDQLRDLATVITYDPVDWPTFVSRARTARVARLVGHALDRVDRVLGASVPADVLEELAGGAQLRLRRRMDGDRVGSLRGLAIAWRRDSAAGSLGAAFRRLRSALLASGRGAGGWDFADPDSRLYYGRPSGGAAMRERFLTGVAQWN